MPIKKSALYRLLILALLTVLSNCSGWHLRGSQQSGLNTANIQKIYLTPATGTVYQQLKSSLDRLGANNDIRQTHLHILLGKQQWQRRSASVGNNALTTEYQLRLTIPYTLTDNSGNTLAEKSSAEISRSYTFDQNDIAGKDKEEQLLRREMARQLARQILQRSIFILNQSQ